MDSELETFLRAYIAALHKRLIFALDQDEKSKTEADLAFFDGAIFCYQDVLKILKAELRSLGHDTDPFEPIMIQAERQQPPAPPKRPSDRPDSSPSDSEML